MCATVRLYAQSFRAAVISFAQVPQVAHRPNGIFFHRFGPVMPLGCVYVWLLGALPHRQCQVKIRHANVTGKTSVQKQWVEHDTSIPVVLLIAGLVTYQSHAIENMRNPANLR
jgi:hypothetical protein